MKRSKFCGLEKASYLRKSDKLIAVSTKVITGSALTAYGICFLRKCERWFFLKAE